MITTVTLNASIDKAYVMDKPIQNGTVMRVSKCHNTAGGKGLNVARAIKTCGEDVLATGLVGGYNGRYLERLLEEDGVAHQFGKIQGETRSCINILDPAFGSTEYLESGAEISADEETVFVEKVFPLAIANSAVVTISGSVPKGASSTVYKRLIEGAKADGKIVLLDTSGAQLKESLSAKPFLVKPNVDELEMLFETKIKGTKEIVEYAHKIRNYGIPNVMISMGSKGTLLSCGEGDIIACPPAVEVVNTVGCGDSMLGAFAVAVIRAMSAEESIRYAVAVGTANALSPSTGSFDIKEMQKLLPQVQITRL